MFNSTGKTEKHFQYDIWTQIIFLALQITFFMLGFRGFPYQRIRPPVTV